MFDINFLSKAFMDCQVCYEDNMSEKTHGFIPPNFLIKHKYSTTFKTWDAIHYKYNLEDVSRPPCLFTKKVK